MYFPNKMPWSDNVCNLNKIELSEKSYILVLYVWKFSYQFLNIKSQFYKYESVTLLFGHPVYTCLGVKS